eukprot:scaffold26075_cov86-Isochrysis_galbana.AAC.2
MSPALSEVVPMMKANSPHVAMAKPTVAAFVRVRGVAHTQVVPLPSKAREKSEARDHTMDEVKERTGRTNLWG